jgi:hypothetical protein
MTIPGRAVRMNTWIWSPFRSMSMLEIPARDRCVRMYPRMATSWWRESAYSRLPAYHLDFHG